LAEPPQRVENGSKVRECVVLIKVFRQTF
jgi:hypothetical protein